MKLAARIAMQGKLSIGWGVPVVLALSSCDAASQRAPKKELSELVRPSQQLEQYFGLMQQALPSAEPGPCPELTIRQAVERSQARSVPFFDESSLALAARGQALDPKLPLAHFVSQVLVQRRPSTLAQDKKSATDAAFDAMTLQKEHDFLAVLKFKLTPPRAEEQGFHAGELNGKLALFELAGGKLLCVGAVFAQSTEEVVGKPGQSPQEAADKDFELQLRRSLQESFGAMTRELNLDLR